MPSCSKDCLSYFAVGDKSKTALVFLHGFLGAKEDWLAIVGQLKKDYYCIAFDLPRHGESQSLSLANFDELDERIASSLTHILKESPLYLIGYS